jgi:hypothetical protein
MRWPGPAHRGTGVQMAEMLLFYHAQGPTPGVAELLLYPGDQHYFADSPLPSYDPDATALLVQRVLGFPRTR